MGRLVSFVISLLGLSCVLAVASASPAREQLEAMTPRSARTISADAARQARFSVVREAGLVVGVDAAYKERAIELRSHLQSVAADLDRIYNFAPLVDNGRLLVPSVELVKDVSAIEGDGSLLRETGRVLRIVEPARLVTTLPTWRDWLSVWQTAAGDAAAERPVDAALPQTREERDVWRSALDEAWVVGRRQADAVFRAELDALTESYLGRLRYRILVEQRIIRPAALGQSDFGIVRESDSVRIEDKLFSIRDAAVFASPSDWRALPRRSAKQGPVLKQAGSGREGDAR